MLAGCLAESCTTINCGSKPGSAGQGVPGVQIFSVTKRSGTHRWRNLVLFEVAFSALDHVRGGGDARVAWHDVWFSFWFATPNLRKRSMSECFATLSSIRGAGVQLWAEKTSMCSPQKKASLTHSHLKMYLTSKSFLKSMEMKVHHIYV